MGRARSQVMEALERNSLKWRRCQGSTNTNCAVWRGGSVLRVHPAFLQTTQVPSPHVVQLTNAWHSSSRRTQHVLPRMAHALNRAHTNLKMIKWIFFKIKLCVPLIPVHVSCVCACVQIHTHMGGEKGVGRHPWSRIYPIYPFTHFSIFSVSKLGRHI